MAVARPIPLVPPVISAVELLSSHLQSLMATKASTEEYDIVIIDSGSTRAHSGQLVEEELDGGNPAVPGDDEIRSGVSRRLTRAARYPWDPPAIAHFLGLGSWLIA